MIKIKYSRKQVWERFDCLNEEQINNIYNIYMGLYKTDKEYNENSPKYRCGYDSLCFISYLTGYFKGENKGKSLYQIWKREHLTKTIPYGVKLAQMFIDNMGRSKVVKIGG